MAGLNLQEVPLHHLTEQSPDFRRALIAVNPVFLDQRIHKFSERHRLLKESPNVGADLVEAVIFTVGGIENHDLPLQIGGNGAGPDNECRVFGNLIHKSRASEI